jgi:hypothetical protein
VIFNIEKIFLFVDADGEMVAEAKSTNTRYKTLSKALSIIDPKRVLITGSDEHNRVIERILSWMDEMEPDEVFRLSRETRRTLDINRSSSQFNWIEIPQTRLSSKYWH